MDFGYTPYSYYAERNWVPDEAYFAKKRESEVYNPNPASQGSRDIPDDVISIIREFSRPLLRYPREYKEALAELGLQDWEPLKAKLSTNQADKVIVCLRSYIAAQRVELQTEREFKNGGSSREWGKAIVHKIRIHLQLLKLLR